MNRIIIIFLLIFVSIQSHGQFSDIDLVNVNGLTIGLEKNNSIWAGYGFKNGIHVIAKHTAIADELSRQSWRISALYGVDLKIVQAVATPFISSDWKTTFYNVGLSLKLRNLWKDNFVKIGAEYIPYYDRDLKFQHGWAVGVQTKLYKQISLFAEYGRKPDYRIAYERMYLGFDIKAKDLCIKPMIEIPSYDSGIRWTHSKIVVSMCYCFAM
jgi:hypothetical protein